MKGLISLFFIVAFLPLSSYSQDKDQLQNKRNRILMEIKETKSLLAKTKSSKTTTLADIRLLQKQVEQQEELISTINKEVAVITRQIRSVTTKITTKEADLEQLKSSYATTVVNAYKKRNTYNQLLFVLSAKDFNNGLRRLTYLKKYSAHKTKQADTIKEKKKELEKFKKVLLASKGEKDDLLKEQRIQKTELTQAKAILDTQLRSIKANESKLLATLSKQQRESRALEKEIERIIALELEAERKRLAAKNTTTKAPTTKTTSKSADLALTPEAALLSKSFSKNRGKLPWPVERGVISQKFGENSSKELAGIKTNNNGINIRTDEAATVRSLFNGEVRSITTIPGYNKVVIISHGAYFTVYGKLTSVDVTVGDTVSTKDKIGVADTAEGITEVHLEIWKGTTKLNPTGWISK